jgi:tRNA(fMet)-specific endonuclease VapC
VLAQLLGVLDVLSISRKVGDLYGAIRADLERRGQTIGHNDLWIAAHAKASNLVLVTANEREFVRVPDLTVENWAR